MAGIGFELRRLSQSETLSSVVGAAGHAAVIAAGPWLFTIVSLFAITLLTERIVGLETLATFRVVVIYSFAVSLIMSAPVAIVATRLVADALWQRRQHEVPALLVGGYGLSLAAVGLGVAVLLLMFPLSRGLAVALAATSALVSLIWIALAFAGAVRDYRGVTLSFLFGLLVSLVASIVAGLADFGAAGMVLGFLLGLTLTLFGLTTRVLKTFPQAVADPLSGARAILSSLSGYWPLAAGAFAAALGVWIDKFVFWASANGEAVEGGLRHAPLYDSAMFIASLVIIPSLAAFMVRLETGFFDRYQRYYATINAHGTYGQIERQRAELSSYTLDNLTAITVAQVGLCAVLVLTAPVIIDLLSMQYRQIAILRFGALGAAFQFVFIAASSMLLFFDRRRLYLAMQLLFLGLNVTLTAMTVRLGDDYHGVGFFLACLAAAVAAFIAADRTFERLNYLTFIGNNPSILPSSAAPPGLGARLIARVMPRSKA